MTTPTALPSGWRVEAAVCALRAVGLPTRLLAASNKHLRERTYYGLD